MSGDTLRTGLILAINLTWELNVSRLTMSLRYSRWSFQDIFLWFFYKIRQISVCGQLVHSRKRGDGLVDNAGKMNTILRSVETIISNDAWDFLLSKNNMMSCPIKFSLTILMMILREGNKKFETKWIFCLDYFINPAVLQFRGQEGRVECQWLGSWRLGNHLV